jgi:hypothetical protein
MPRGRPEDATRNSWKIKLLKLHQAKSRRFETLPSRRYAAAGRVPNNKELWFRAEDSTYKDTHLQPGLYRPKCRQPGSLLWPS